MKTSNILESFTQRSSKGHTGPASSCPVGLGSPHVDHNPPKGGYVTPALRRSSLGEWRWGTLWQVHIWLTCFCMWSTPAEQRVPVCSESPKIPISQVCQVMKFPEHANLTIFTSTSRSCFLVTWRSVRRQHNHKREKFRQCLNRLGAIEKLYLSLTLVKNSH